VIGRHGQSVDQSSGRWRLTVRRNTASRETRNDFRRQVEECASRQVDDDTGIIDAWNAESRRYHWDRHWRREIVSSPNPPPNQMRGRAFGRARAGVTARTGLHHCFGGVVGAGGVPGFAGTGAWLDLALRRGVASARRMSSTCGARLAVSGRLASRLAMA